MKRFILTMITSIILVCNLSAQRRTYAEQRMSVKISPTYFFGNSVFVDQNTSFTDFRRESSLFNKSNSIGISGIFTILNKRRYYQSNEYGIRIIVQKSESTQKITYDPTPSKDFSDIYIVRDKYSFIEVPILFTQASSNHQLFIYELGPVYTYYLNEKSSKIGIMLNLGIYNHISERISYSVLFSSNYTRLSENSYRLVNGLQMNFIYRISSR